MSLTRRNFLKRLSGSLAALGILPTVLPEPPATIEALTTTGTNAVTMYVCDDFQSAEPTFRVYEPGKVYYGVTEDGGTTWHLATYGVDQDGAIGIAISETEIITPVWHFYGDYTD